MVMLSIYQGIGSACDKAEERSHILSRWNKEYDARQRKTVLDRHQRLVDSMLDKHKLCPCPNCLLALTQGTLSRFEPRCPECGEWL